MAEQRKPENVLKLYFIINLCFIFLHPMLYLMAVMGIGGRTGDITRGVFVNIVLFIAAIGASPNFLLLLASLIRRKQVSKNLLWAAIFSALIFVSYFSFFWRDIQSFPL